MLRAAAIFVFVFCGILFPNCSAYSLNISTDIYGVPVTLKDDTIIAPFVTVDVDYINVASSLRMHNSGFIASDINICDGCDLFLKNSGIIDGTIRLGDGSSLVHVVNDDVGMTRLSVDAPYTVLIVGASDILWSDATDIGQFAGNLHVRNSKIIVDDVNVADDFRMMRSVMNGPNIEMSGVIHLKLESGYSNDAPVIRNVFGDAEFIVDADVGPLHALQAVIYGADLYVKKVRETDYYKILGNSTGDMLNKLREVAPDSALLARLDSAQTMNQLYSMMADSIALNPMLLARPLRDLNDFVVNNVILSGTDNENSVGVYTEAEPFYIYSDKVSFVGTMAAVRVYGGDGYSFTLSGYGAAAESDDAINSFSADVYGEAFLFNYSGDYTFARILAGASHADFELPYVFDSGHIRSHVAADTIYGVADIGAKINMKSYLVLYPYAGLECGMADILSETDTWMATRVGADAAISINGADLRYDYKVGVGVNSNNRQSFGLSAGFWSSDDAAGGEIGLRIMRVPDNVSYMISVSIKSKF